MRFAVVSDTHFGDPMCQLACWKGNEKKDKVVIGPKYDAFKTAAGVDNDYLILLGDIFDFSICSYKEAYEVGKAFFTQLQKDKIAKYIIYVPGNHDADMWHFYEYQANIIVRMSAGKPPYDFRFSVPGIIDGRKKATGDRFFLRGVSKNPKYPGFGYGGMFLDKITINETTKGRQEGKPIVFAFAYPNLYLITEKETVLMTHGHYLESYWSLLSEWVLKVVREDLRIGDALDLWEMVAINFPLNQLACSGTGQSGPLTEIVRKIQREVKDKDLTRVKKYLDNLDNEIDKLTPSSIWQLPREVATDALSNLVKKEIMKGLEKYSETRYSEEFFHKRDVLDRFRRFMDCSLLEIDLINKETSADIRPPRYVIFGHTHEPIPWNDPNAPKTMNTGGNPVTLYNTGGWLNHMNKKTNQPEFCGAEVFIYDSNRSDAMTSKTIR
ncbi:putative Metallophosphoesterase [Candidatus Zixiibacteriota bacterium]|nr:putative Metallophosphoesterase [candidate division Zixibacteria bacterium]